MIKLGDRLYKRADGSYLEARVCNEHDFSCCYCGDILNIGEMWIENTESHGTVYCPGCVHLQVAANGGYEPINERNEAYVRYTLGTNPYVNDKGHTIAIVEHEPEYDDEDLYCSYCERRVVKGEVSAVNTIDAYEIYHLYCIDRSGIGYGEGGWKKAGGIDVIQDEHGSLEVI